MSQASAPQTTSSWNLPNALTVLRLVLVPLFGWLLLRDDGTNATSRILAAVVFLIASLTDLADGEIARRQNTVTSFGKIADPIADKALTGMARALRPALANALRARSDDDARAWLRVLETARRVPLQVESFAVAAAAPPPATTRRGSTATCTSTVRSAPGNCSPAPWPSA